MRRKNGFRVQAAYLAVFVIILMTACTAATPSSAPPTHAVTPPPPTQTKLAEPVTVAAVTTPIPTPLAEKIGALTNVVDIPHPVSDAVSEFTGSIGWSQVSFLGLSADDWINLVISLAIFLAALAIATWLVMRILRYIVHRTPNKFDDAFLEEIKPQIRWLVAVLGIHIALARLLFISPAWRIIFANVYFILYLTIFVLVFWKLTVFSTKWITEHAGPEKNMQALGPIFTLIRRLVILFLAILYLTILLSYFGVNLSAVITALGIGGLAISLAAQDTLANAISGFIILLDRPFRVGDFIEIVGLNTTGEIMEIGTRSTRIRTFDNRMVIIPNSTLANNQIVNLTLPDPNYREQIDILVKYGTDVEKVRQTILDTLNKTEGILQDKPLDVLLTEMGASGLVFRARWWISSYVNFRQFVVTEAIYKALSQAGVEIPFTTYDVSLKLKDEDFRSIAQPQK